MLYVLLTVCILTSISDANPLTEGNISPSSISPLAIPFIISVLIWLYIGISESKSILKDEGYIKIDRRKGAFISLNLEESNNKFKRNFEEELEYYIAECCNRGISKDDINKIIDEKYGLFKEKK